MNIVKYEWADTAAYGRLPTVSDAYYYQENVEYIPHPYDILVPYKSLKTAQDIFSKLPELELQHELLYLDSKNGTHIPYMLCFRFNTASDAIAFKLTIE